MKLSYHARCALEARTRLSPLDVLDAVARGAYEEDRPMLGRHAAGRVHLSLHDAPVTLVVDEPSQTIVTVLSSR